MQRATKDSNTAIFIKEVTFQRQLLMEQSLQYITHLIHKDSKLMVLAIKLLEHHDFTHLMLQNLMQMNRRRKDTQRS